MKVKNIFLLTGLMIVIYGSPISAQGQSASSLTTVTSVVVDENGNPVSGAIIRGNEGSTYTRTDADGQFTISVSPQSQLLIESIGYEPTVFTEAQYSDEAQLRLYSAPLLEGSRDTVPIAFGKTTKKQLINAVEVLNVNDIREYDNINTVAQALEGRVAGMYGTNNLRGIGAPLYVVDGLPRSIANLRLSEVESVSVLKDINAAVLYGSQARNGVVLINTKRGEAHKKDIKVTSYYGVNTPQRLPSYLSSADYMELNNEARLNDGLTPIFNAPTIENYRTGNPYRYPNVDYYSSDYMRQIKPFNETIVELRGGGDRAKYYLNTGWERTGSYLNYGEGEKENQNRFNVRGNVDVNLASWITATIDATAYFNNTRNPRGANFWQEASTMHPHTISPLIPMSYINPEHPLLIGRKADIDGLYLPGGNQANLTNSIASGHLAGYLQRQERLFTFNNRINFDLGRVLEGLSFRTNMSFDYYSIYDQAIQNEYSVYEPVWSEHDEIIDLIQHGVDRKPGVFYAGNSQYNRRIGFYGMLDYNRTFNQDHEISAGLLGFTNTHEIIDYIQPVRNHTAGLRLGYAYKQKYLVDLNTAYVHSTKLPAGNRGAFSPSVGLAWLISNEDFMQSASAVDYLKLRVSAGILNTDETIDGHYLHINRYEVSSMGYSWNDGGGGYSRSSVIAMYGANPRMGFEKYKDLNIGLDGQFFNQSLWLSTNFFVKSNYDLLVRPQTIYPNFYNPFMPYENFGENVYRGFDLGLSYSNKIGDFRYEIGGNLLYTAAEIKRRDEVFVEDYRYRQGTSLFARWGLVADGLFEDQADIDNHAAQAFGVVRPGDIKYVDQNGDGIIDARDEQIIGTWMAPWSYGLNLKFSYDNFTLFLQGTGMVGNDQFREGSYFWMDGNAKYSEYARDRWTEDTKHTATMPRLTSVANQNNHRHSTFWMYRDNFFNLNRTQLSYSLPSQLTDKWSIMNVGVFVDATNLLMISKHNEIRQLRIGSEPYSRNFSLGVRATF